MSGKKSVGENNDSCILRSTDGKSCDFTFNVNVDDLLSKYVGACGIWQWTIVFLSALCAPSMATFPVFVNAVPDYRCKLSPNAEDILVNLNLTFDESAKLVGPWKSELSTVQVGCFRYKLNWTDVDLVRRLFNNQSSTLTLNRTELKLEECTDGYVYKSKKFQYPGSIVAEFDLVCNRSWFAPTGTSLFMFGMVIGFFVGGWAADKFGRRRTALGFSLLEIVAAVGVSCAPNHHVYHVMRTIVGFTNTGKTSVLRVLPIELTLARYRSYFSSFFVLGMLFAHRAYMAGVAYLVPNWRYLNAILSVPCLSCLFFFCILPESPRWLMSQSRTGEALRVLRTGCRINHLFRKDRSKLMQLDKFVARYDESCEKAFSPQPKDQLGCTNRRKYFRLHIPSKKIRMTLLITTLLFTAYTFSFFGILLYARSINDSVYIVVFINAVMGIPGPVIASIAYRRFRYRRTPLLIVNTISFVALLIGGVYTLIFQPETDIVLNICCNCTLVMFCTAMIMKMIYVAELFPSNMRVLGVGISSGFGRMGSSLSTFANQLDTYILHGVPVIIYCGISLIQMILLCFLRDTSGENLPDIETHAMTESNIKISTEIRSTEVQMNVQSAPTDV